MTDTIRGIHPRLVPRPPAPRPSLAILAGLREVGDDFAWAVWYAVWRVRGGDEPPVADAAAGVAERFAAAAAAVPEMAEPVRVLCAHLRDGEAPTDAADALLRISEWALEKALAEPAMQCAEASVALVPASARRALAAGRASRIFGEVARAEMFYERAVTLARVQRRWRSYVRGHLGLGQVKKALGDPAAARAHYYTAARAARGLSGEKWLAAQTRHDLMALAAEDGAYDEALEHARQALAWYPRHHARFPALAHDIAFLVVRLDLYGPAVPLLKAVMRADIPPQDQVIGWSTLARAAAGTNDETGYRAAADEVLRRVGLFDLYAAASFANLAWGACLLGKWGEAEQYASRSLELARNRPQAEAASVASAVLDHVLIRQTPAPRTSPDDPRTVHVLQLAAELAPRLASWRGATWKRKQQYGLERLGSV